MLYYRGVLNPTWSKSFNDYKRNTDKKLPIARNLSKFGRKVVEAVSTDAVPNTFY